MDGLWDEKDDADGAGAGEGCLQPEDLAPGGVGDDYAAYEGAEGWSDLIAVQWCTVLCTLFESLTSVPDRKKPYAVPLSTGR